MTRQTPSFSRRRALSLLGSAAVSVGMFGDTALAVTAIPSTRILVLVELNGGNDGLNTVIPVEQQGYYKRLRPQLGLNANRLLTINSEIALNDRLAPLMPVIEKQQLSLINDVGYPVPNRSHFASRAIIRSGGDGQNRHATGWVARSLDPYSKAHDMEHAGWDLLGATFDGVLGSMKGGAGLFMDLGDIERVKALNSTDPLSNTTNPLIKHIEAKRQLYNEAASRLHQHLDKRGPDPVALRSIPNSLFGRQAKQAVRLIASGLRLPVIKLSLKGFDTHTGQAGQHDRLLQELAQTLASFCEAMTEIGRIDDVVCMTCSEFGRTLRENGSAGTDHGAAAPHFVLGGRIRGGVIGTPVNLESAPKDGFEHRVDYRTILRILIERHLGINEHPFFEQQTTMIGELLPTA